MGALPMNKIVMSTGPLPVIIGEDYHDLDGIIRAMQKLWKTGAVDGFEFQNQAEWVVEARPRERAERRGPRWEVSTKYTWKEVAAKLEESNLPITSIHANRDAGIYLCCKSPEERAFGRRLLDDSLRLAQAVEAPVLVIHLWDTFEKTFDIDVLRQTLNNSSTPYPNISVSVENIPTSRRGSTPYSLVKDFEFITLDLRWAGMYDELDRFELVKDRIVNVHMRGQLEGKEWVLHNAPFSLGDALNKILKEWKYQGLLTMEAEGGLRDASWEDFVAATKALRKNP
jgi:sugar phosphate isomerase/epimerase